MENLFCEQGASQMTDDQVRVIQSDHEMRETETLVLVPDGTLCFIRPVVNDEGIWYTSEIVWMRPNEEGIWEGRGELSGHLYRHGSWFKKLLERQQAAQRNALKLLVEERPTPSRRQRLVWRLTRPWRRFQFRRRCRQAARRAQL